MQGVENRLVHNFATKSNLPHRYPVKLLRRGRAQQEAKEGWRTRYVRDLVPNRDFRHIAHAGVRERDETDAAAIEQCV